MACRYAYYMWESICNIMNFGSVFSWSARADQLAGSVHESQPKPELLLGLKRCGSCIVRDVAELTASPPLPRSPRSALAGICQAGSAPGILAHEGSRIARSSVCNRGACDDHPWVQGRSLATNQTVQYDIHSPLSTICTAEHLPGLRMASSQPVSPTPLR